MTIIIKVSSNFTFDTEFQPILLNLCCHQMPHLNAVGIGIVIPMTASAMPSAFRQVYTIYKINRITKRIDLAMIGLESRYILIYL